MSIFKKLKLLKILMKSPCFYELYKGGKKCDVWKFENTFIDPKDIEFIRKCFGEYYK